MFHDPPGGGGEGWIARAMYAMDGIHAYEKGIHSGKKPRR